MNLCVRVMVALVFLGGGTAWAQRGMDEIGACDGDMLFTYQPGVGVTAAFCPDAVPNSSCGLRDCVTEGCVGYACVGNPGAPCLAADEGPHCNVGQGLGCVDGTCQPAAVCDPATFVPSCQGNTLTTCQHTVAVQECTFGGTVPGICGVGVNGRAACLGIDGATCGPGGDALCAPGHTCVNDVCRRNDGVETACVGVASIGACNGDVVTRCVGGMEVTLDCAAEFGAGAGCGLLDCTQDGCTGYFCVSRQGAACEDLPCDVSQGLGCINGVCQPSTPCDEQSFVSLCQGTSLVFCRNTVQEFECTGGGVVPFTCGVAPEGDMGCLGGLGSSCDISSNLGCAPGLGCVNGRCAVVETPDAGMGAGSSSTSASASVGGTSAGLSTSTASSLTLSSSAFSVASSSGVSMGGGVSSSTAPSSSSAHVSSGTTGGTSTSRGSTSVTASSAAPSSGSGGASASVSSSAEAPSSSSGGTAEPEKKGCVCAAPGSGASGVWSVLLLALLGVRRRFRWDVTRVAGAVLVFVTVGSVTQVRAQTACVPGTRNEGQHTVTTTCARVGGINWSLRTSQELLAGYPVLQPPPRGVRQNSSRAVVAGMTDVIRGLENGYRVGPAGTQTCVGVLVVSTNGTVIAAHYDPTTRNAGAQLGAALRSVCLPGARAYVNTSDFESHETGAVMGEVLDTLRAAGVPLAGYVVGQSVFSDNDGNLTVEPTAPRKTPGDTQIALRQALVKGLASRRDPTLAARADRRNAQLAGLPPRQCAITGTVQASCPDAPADVAVLAGGTVRLSPYDCTQSSYPEYATLDTNGRINAEWPPGAEFCSALQEEYPGVYVEPYPVQYPQAVELPVLTVTGARTSVVGQVRNADGSPEPAAAVTWGPRTVLADVSGRFSFALDWDECSVTVYAESARRTPPVEPLGRGYAGPIPAVKNGVTDVGTIVLCGPGRQHCAASNTCIGDGECCGTQPCLGTGGNATCRARDRTNYMVGFSEFVPSTPPKKYLTINGSGSTYFHLFWSQDTSCVDFRWDETRAYSGSATFDPVTEQITDNRNGGMDDNPCVSVMATATERTNSVTSGCGTCWWFPYDQRAITSDKREWLTDEDTEEAALARRPIEDVPYNGEGPCTHPSRTTFHRRSGFTIAQRQTQVRIQAFGLIAGRSYEAHVALERRPAGTAQPYVDAGNPLLIPFAASATTYTGDWVSLPQEAPWEYRTGAVTFHGGQ